MCPKLPFTVRNCELTIRRSGKVLKISNLNGVNNFSSDDIKDVIIKVGSKSKDLQELHGNNLRFNGLSKCV